MKSGRKSQILDRESKLWGAVTKIGVLVAIFLITDAFKDQVQLFIFVVVFFEIGRNFLIFSHACFSKSGNYFFIKINATFLLIFLLFASFFAITFKLFRLTLYQNQPCGNLYNLIKNLLIKINPLTKIKIKALGR